MTDDVDWQPGIVFTHTLSLTLDDKAQEILQSIRDQLMAVGVPVLHQPAHITVAAVSTMEGVDSHLVDVGWPERITLTKSCRLPNSDGVVGLCPHDPTSSDPVTIFDTSSEGEPELCSAPPSVGSFRALTCLPEDLRRPHELLHRRLAAAGVIAFNYYGLVVEPPRHDGVSSSARTTRASRQNCRWRGVFGSGGSRGLSLAGR